jgi:hypothetical protein
LHNSKGRDGKLNKTTVLLKEPRTSFLVNVNIKKEERLDDQTFNVWKTELLKELPLFWEEMSQSKKK